MRHVLLCILYLARIAHGQGQIVDQIDSDPESIVESISPVDGMSDDDGAQYEVLMQRLSNPIDLNQATDEELRSLFMLSESQLHALIRYRKEQGPLLSKYELQTIPEFDEPTLRRIDPLITVRVALPSMRGLIGRITHERNNYLLMRVGRTVENAAGYRRINGSPAYAGAPYNIYTRFKTTGVGDFSLGFTLSQDAGEPFRWHPINQPLGFDYASAHLQVVNKGIIKNAILGDYQAQFGQGLALGGGFSLGKNAETITSIRKSSIGFTPYSSANEANFFRGAALSLEPIRRVTLHAFFSYNLQDGNLVSERVEEGASSILFGGLHRTTTELQNRKTLAEINYGAVVSYKNRRLEVGGIAHITHFGAPIRPPSRTYNQFAFSGKQNINLSLFANYQLSNLTLFGEVCGSIDHGLAYLIGLIYSISARLDVALLHRRYAPDFYGFYTNALAENSAAQNEEGYYIGIRYAISKYYTLAGYVDLFRFPWLRYNSYAPSLGAEWLVRFAGAPSKQISFYLQARQESKARHTGAANLFTIAQGVKSSYAISCEYALTPHVQLRSRIQYGRFELEKKHSEGWSIVQDIDITLGKVSLSLRYAFFDTDDYDTRQYVSERNVWLSYSFPAYYGVGIRSYAMARYAISRRVSIWVRWSRTFYNDRSAIGSGNDAIEGNEKNDLIFQARIKL